MLTKAQKGVKTAAPHFRAPPNHIGGLLVLVVGLLVLVAGGSIMSFVNVTAANAAAAYEYYSYSYAHYGHQIHTYTHAYIYKIFALQLTG